MVPRLPIAPTVAATVLLTAVGYAARQAPSIAAPAPAAIERARARR